MVSEPIYAHSMGVFGTGLLSLHPGGGGGGGVLSHKRLMGMCRWMGRIFTTGLTINGSRFQ